MVAPPPVNQQGGAVTDFVLTIDARRVRGWIEGRRHICVGADGKHYTAVLEAEDTPGFEGVFNARIEELPGCVSYGEDLATARTNLHEALDLYLEEDAAEQN
jgi:predicted RNase H-like HicB family nuclease